MLGCQACAAKPGFAVLGMELWASYMLGEHFLSAELQLQPCFVHFKKRFVLFLIMCMDICVDVSVWMLVHKSAGAHTAQKRVSESLELEIQVAVSWPL